MTTQLPKLKVPHYTLILPSTGKELKYRPFLVKEEKILLTALGEKGEIDDAHAVDAIKQVVENCTYDKIKINNLPLFDLEYIFIKIREKSKGEVIDLAFNCQQNIEDENGNSTKCNHQNKVKFDLRNVEIKRSDEHTNKIILDETENIGVVLKYPTFEVFSKLTLNTNASGLSLESLVDCIDCIFQGDTIYESDLSDKKDMLEFFEGMNTQQIGKIEEFFTTMPKVIGKINYTCGKCKTAEEFEVEGIINFLE